MRAYNLSFISDEDLYRHTKDTVDKYRFSIDLESFTQNIIDPIKLSFDSIIYQRSINQHALMRLIEDEIHRQIDKSNANHIGYFHQNIFKYIGKNEGWIVPKTGFDVANPEQFIFVEMKNKHNTMNSSSSAKTYLRMQHQLLKQPQSLCLLVEVLAKQSQNCAWTCRVDGQQFRHEQIRRLSIDHFYALVTKEHDAFAQLCRILPAVIFDVVQTHGAPLIQNSVLRELETQPGHLLQNLYLSAFKSYQGFENFQFSHGLI